MMDESSFGSSEYSAEAEELFAQYLLARDVGEPIDFDAYASEHEQWTEELYGLHTDWDNVRGLLGRLRSKQEVGAPEPEPEPELQPEPVSAEERHEPEPEPVPPVPLPSRRPFFAALGVLLLIACGVSFVAIELYRTGEVLAAESKRLEVEGEQTRGLLESVRQEVAVVEGERAALTTDLEQERAARAEREAQLASEQAALRAARTERERVESELRREAARVELLRLAVVAEELRHAAVLSGGSMRYQGAELEAWRTNAQEILEAARASSAQADEVELGEVFEALAALQVRVTEELELLARAAAHQQELEGQAGLLESFGLASGGSAGALALPPGIVVMETHGENPHLWRFRDLTVEFASDELVYVPAREQGAAPILLTRWAELSSAEAELATRLGYRKLSAVEAAVLGANLGTEGGASRWARGLW